ncbi:MAG: polysaccharide deacetylase family protein [Clostridiales bacterium]|nr:polysaccharide deacetylase family protein [Clostridiales bacterium]
MKKQVYLTIDDAPTKYFKDKVDYLYERKIPAIIFCVGSSIEKYMDDVVYAIKKGFLIGNHSYAHEHFSDLTIEQGVESIRKTDRIVDEVYRKAGVQRPMKVFRFPYFDTGANISGTDYESGADSMNKERPEAFQAVLKELGYVQPAFRGIKLEYFSDKASMFEYLDVKCTFDQMEYNLGRENAPYGTNTEEAILGRIDEDVPYEGRALNRPDTTDIILVHDHENTTELFYKLIDRYIEKGFEFLSVL